MKRKHDSQSGKWVVMVIPSVTICMVMAVVLLVPLSKTSSSSSSVTWSSSWVNLTEEVEVGVPRFAYMLTGSKGEGEQVKRVLQAVYHPRNQYLLHLDLEASDAERMELAKYVKSETVFAAFGNVMVVGKADLVTYKGPTMMASTLHGIALLLKRLPRWDWFLNLSAYDYPLLSQDGIKELGLSL